MGKLRLIIVLVCVCLLVSVAAYSISSMNLLGIESGGTDGDSSTPSPTASSTPTPTPSTSPSPSPTTSPSSGSAGTDGTSTTPSPTASSVYAENAEDHEDSADYVWDSTSVVNITLNGNSITVNASGVATVDGSKITITSAGTYRISGSLTDGQITVDTDDEETIRLILNGVNIRCSTSSPIYILSAKKAIIILEENTVNYVADSASYVLEAGEDEPNAAIFSKSDLTIFGSGSLNVNGNYNDGIASKDGLIIKSGTITVNAVDDGIRGKDYLVVKGGAVALNVGGDGLKSDNADDAAKGYVSVENGVINITSDGDAVDAETDIIISGGEISLTSGGGSNSVIYSSTSAKGLKANVSITIDAGTITVNSADDAINSNEQVTINGGSFVISSGDDAFHADSSLTINGGDITIAKSFEGIESVIITINGGNIHIVSSDDGINGAGGNDASGFTQGPDRGGGRDQGGFTNSGNCYLYINGGYIVVDAAGDGIDVNGAIVMTDGYVIVNGPTSNANGALDHVSFKITGGFLLAVGSSGMAQAPGTSSTQYSILLNFRSSMSAGTLINIQTSDGTVLFSFKPTKAYQSVVFSSAALTKGSTYNVYYGGSSTGTANDGLYLSGTYTPGTKYTTFTISSVTTTVYW